MWTLNTHLIYVTVSLLLLQALSFQRATISKFNGGTPGDVGASICLKDDYRLGSSALGMSDGDMKTSSGSSPPLNYHPDGTSYIMCGACKTAYIVEANQFDAGGKLRINYHNIVSPSKKSL